MEDVQHTHSSDAVLNKLLVNRFTEVAGVVHLAADTCSLKKAVLDSAVVEKRWYSDMFAASRMGNHAVLMEGDVDL